jgi:hypothetical protein
MQFFQIIKVFAIATIQRAHVLPIIQKLNTVLFSLAFMCNYQIKTKSGTKTAAVIKCRGEPCVLNPPNAAQPTSPANSGGSLAAASIVPPPRRRASPTRNTTMLCLLPTPDHLAFLRF